MAKGKDNHRNQNLESGDLRECHSEECNDEAISGMSLLVLPKEIASLRSQ
jgi:hypothetical protein